MHYYDKTEVQRQRHLSYVKEKIKKSNDPLLLQMMRIADSVVAHYSEDFYVHDLNYLKAHEYKGKNQEFLWIVRESGTHLLCLNTLEYEVAYDTYGNEQRIWNVKTYFDMLVRTFSQRKMYVYHIKNGRNIEKLSVASAYAVIAIAEDRLKVEENLKNARNHFQNVI